MELNKRDPAPNSMECPVVILLFVINVYLPFVPTSGTELPNWNFPWHPVMRALEVSFVVLMVTFGPYLRMEAGCQENQPGD